MKIEETLLIISLLGTVSQATKLLKVPRIYNAVITSDKELLPSQAFPALSPILHSIHYPQFANTLYQPMLTQPMLTQDLYKDIKTDDKTMNQYDYAKGIPSQPVTKTNIPGSIQNQIPPLFTPNNRPKSGEEDMPNVIPNSNFNAKRPENKMNFYPHYDDEIGQIFNVMNYENKKVYSASSPVLDSPSFTPNALLNGFPFLIPQPNKPQITSVSSYQYSQNEQTTSKTVKVSNEGNPIYDNPSPQPDLNQFPINYNFIKNNGPKDTNIVDVPPPPLPIGKSVPQ